MDEPLCFFHFHYRRSSVKKTSWSKQNRRFFDTSNKQLAMPLKDSARLSTLPVEILDQIFNHLDGTTVFLSVRKCFVNDSVQWSIMCTIDMNWTWHHSPNVIFIDFLSSSIHNVSLASPSPIEEQHPDRSACFDRWSTSVALRNFVHWLCWRSKHTTCVHFLSMPRDVHSHLSHSTRDASLIGKQRRTCGNISRPIISQPTLIRLRLLREGICELIDQLEWPVECKLQHLTMACVTKKRLGEILLRASDLQNTRHWHKSGLFCSTVGMMPHKSRSHRARGWLLSSS